MMALYSALPASPAHIRVLELCSGTGPLTCQLRTAILGECKYETISYCWSDAAEDDPFLIVNEQRVRIRKNLASALTRLRLSDQARTLWVDALCINQTSNTEKREQVSMMRDIYAKGVHNNIWLGEEEPSTARVLDFARDLARQGSKKSSNAIFALLSSPQKLLYISDSPLYGLLALCDKPWFHRGWVVQEVTAAKASTAHCGSCSISWEELSMAKELLVPIRSTYDSMSDQRMAYMSKSDDLASVLARNVAYQYTDPRDRVYAMLGLVEDQKRYGMEADYAANPTDVLVKATYACIEQRADLDILSIVPSRVGKGEDCPSWVISSRFSWEDDTMAFQTFAWGSRLSRNTLDRRPRFSCTAGSTPNCYMNPRDRTLQLTGVLWDHVKTVGIPYSPKPAARATRFGFFNDILDGLYPWLTWRQVAEVSSAELYPLTQETRFTVFWHIISGGVLCQDYFDEEALYAQFEDTYKVFLWLPHCWCSSGAVMATVLVFCFFRAWILIVLGKKNLASMGCRHCPLICNRRVFVTVGGALGMGPKAMQAGDFILLAQGGKVPLILRQLDNERWQLIGESYVHGIMHGEAYKEDLCEPVVIV